MRIALGVLVAVASFPFAVAGQAPAAGPTFDVVSVKPHGAGGDAVLAGAMMTSVPTAA